MTHCKDSFCFFFFKNQFLKFTLPAKNTLQLITGKIPEEVLPETLNQKLSGAFNTRSISLLFERRTAITKSAILIFAVYSSYLREELRLQTQRF